MTTSAEPLAIKESHREGSSLFLKPLPRQTRRRVPHRRAAFEVDLQTSQAHVLAHGASRSPRAAPGVPADLCNPRASSTPSAPRQGFTAARSVVAGEEKDMTPRRA